MATSSPQKRPVIASPKAIDRAAVDGGSRGPFADLRRRIQLTIRYHGWRTLLFRVLTLPLRLTPLRHRLRLRSHARRRRLPPRARVVRASGASRSTS